MILETFLKKYTYFIYAIQAYILYGNAQFDGAKKR